MSLIDVNAVQKEAEKELREEAEKAAKTQIKSKMKAISTAKTVVANLERELADLIATIGEGNGE